MASHGACAEIGARAQNKSVVLLANRVRSEPTNPEWTPPMGPYSAIDRLKASAVNRAARKSMEDQWEVRRSWVALARARASFS